jgi:copper resistance protein B
VDQVGGYSAKQRYDVYSKADPARLVGTGFSDIEIDLYSKPDPARFTGAGFADIDTGLRLRYEFSRNFAPYIGLVYEGNFGQTASYAKRVGQSTGDSRFTFGVRIWF